MIRNPALKNRDYRRLLAGAAFNQQGMSGEQVVIGILVLQATGSTAWVGIALAVYFLSFFALGLLSGAVADWIDRRVLLRRLELSTAASLAAFATTFTLGTPPVWLIILFTLFAGSLRALHQPVRSSYAYDLVGEANVVEGIGLLNLGSRAGQLLGALVAGYVMQRHGAPAALYCLAFGHTISFVLFHGLKSAGIAAVAVRKPIWQNILEYVGELRANRLLLILLAVTASVEIFGFSFATALPEIATERLNLGPEGLGFLQGTRAFAGICAGIAFATFGSRRRTGALYLSIIVAFGAAMVFLSGSTLFVTTLAAVFLVSLCAASCDILSQSMMQLSVANELRGRAMGVWVLALGFGPLGHLELGAVSDALGISSGLFLNAMILLGIGTFAAMAMPRLRRL